MQEDLNFPRILVLGGAGRVGRPLVAQALDGGYSVTALVRDPTRLADLEHPALRLIEGDANDPNALVRCFEPGIDAVLSTLGTYIKKPGTPTTDTTRVVVESMQTHGVPRLVVMSSLGVGESRRWGGLVEQFVMRVILRHVLADKSQQEALLHRSDLDWTVLRPPRILDADDCRDYERWTSEPPRRRLRWKINRADAAREMLRLLADPSTTGQAWHISY